MARTSEKLLTTRAPMKSLVLAVGIFFACQGTAIAAVCLDRIPPSGFLLPGSVTAPEPADRLAIMDVISLFFWARDGNATGFRDLFTDDIVFELCTAGGGQQVTMQTGPDDLDAYLGDLTTYLDQLVLRTRHIAGGTILNVKDPDTVEGKTTVLVLLQNAYSEQPVLDYTATLKTEFERGDDGVWKFSRLTIIGDTTIPGTSGVRGR